MHLQSVSKPPISGPLLAVAGALALAACGAASDDGAVLEGFLGTSIAEEPRAALVGRDVLAAGGTAADAAVAVYFTLAVTLPTAASLGGGGACLIQDRATGTLEALEFLATPPPRFTNASAPADTVAPANPRGMFALHARYGRRDWAELLAPAERFARDGHAVSRATAMALAAAAPTVDADPTLSRLFTAADGTPLREGMTLRQIELGALLTAIRSRGPGGLYGGPLGRQFVDSLPAGNQLTTDDMRAVRPRFRDALQLPAGDAVAAFLPPPVVGGTVAGQVWAALGEGPFDPSGVRQVGTARAAAGAVGDWARSDGNTAVPLPDLVGDARIAALAAAPQQVPPRAVPAALATGGTLAGTTAGTAFVTADLAGQVVACAVTMHRPLGAGAAASGVVLSAAPDPAVPVPLSAMLLVNRNVQTTSFAAAAAGPADLLPPVAHAVISGGAAPAAALAAPRVLYDPAADVVLVEAGAGQAGAAVAAAGYTTRVVDGLGRVAVLSCPDGLPRSFACAFANDPRGPGLAAATE